MSLAEEDLLADTARQEEMRKTATSMGELSEGFLMRNMEEVMAKDRHLWHLGMDKRLLVI